MAKATMKPHADRRVVRTKRSLRQAFFELLVTTPYQKITITALANKADIDRKTFYTHYASIDDLFQDIIYQETERVLCHLETEDLFDDPARFTKSYFYELAHVVDLTKRERSQMLRHLPVYKLIHYSTTITHELLCESIHDISPEEREYLNVVIQMGLAGIFYAYAQWLNEETALTFDELLDLAGTTLSHGLSGLIEQGAIPKPSSLES